MPPFWADTLRMVGAYTAANALIMLVLSMLVVRARVRTDTPIGDGGNPAMMAPMRAHENNTEYVPIVLVLLVVAAAMRGNFYMIHIIGGTLTLGRLLHAIGLSLHTGPSLLRLLGMAFTWLSMIAGILAVVLLVIAPPIS